MFRGDAELGEKNNPPTFVLFTGTLLALFVAGIGIVAVEIVVSSPPPFALACLLSLLCSLSNICRFFNSFARFFSSFPLMPCRYVYLIASALQLLLLPLVVVVVAAPSSSSSLL